MQIHVDPWNPNARPDIKFLGPEKMITHFKDKMVLNLQVSFLNAPLKLHRNYELRFNL